MYHKRYQKYFEASKEIEINKNLIRPYYNKMKIYNRSFNAPSGRPNFNDIKKVEYSKADQEFLIIVQGTDGEDAWIAFYLEDYSFDPIKGFIKD